MIRASNDDGQTAGDRRRRILMVHQGAELYGSDKVFADVVDLVSAFADPIVVLDSGGPLVAKLEKRGTRVEIFSLGVLRRGNFTLAGTLRTGREIATATRRLVRVIRSDDVDLVYTSTIGVLPGAFAAFWTRRPHLWHVHEIILQPRWLAKALATAVGRLSERAICVSRAVAANLATGSAAASRRALVVHNGVRLPILSETALFAAKEEVGETLNRFTIAMVGRISTFKGQDYLLDALAAMDAATLGRTQVLIVGDCFRGNESLVRRLKARANLLGLGQIVRFLGFRADAAELVAVSDAVVMPSTLPEPFGLSAVEAMLLAKPVVVTSIGGLREIVVDGATGFLVPAGKPELFARCLERLANDPMLARRMGAEGQARVRAEFSYEKFAGEIRGIFADVLGNASGGASSGN